jgi:hypothetical protein
VYIQAIRDINESQFIIKRGGIKRLWSELKVSSGDGSGRRMELVGFSYRLYPSYNGYNGVGGKGIDKMID